MQIFLFLNFLNKNIALIFNVAKMKAISWDENMKNVKIPRHINGLFPPCIPSALHVKRSHSRLPSLRPMKGSGCVGKCVCAGLVVFRRINKKHIDLGKEYCKPCNNSAACPL